MNTNDNGRADARSRANRRLRAMTIGTAVAGVMATGTFAGVAAFTYDGSSGSSSALATTTTTDTTTTSNQGADTATTGSTSLSTTGATVTPTPSATATATATPVVTSATGAAHATTGGS